MKEKTADEKIQPLKDLLESLKNHSPQPEEWESRFDNLYSELMVYTGEEVTLQVKEFIKSEIRKAEEKAYSRGREEIMGSYENEFYVYNKAITDAVAVLPKEMDTDNMNEHLFQTSSSYNTAIKQSKVALEALREEQAREEGRKEGMKIATDIMEDEIPKVIKERMPNIIESFITQYKEELLGKINKLYQDERPVDCIDGETPVETYGYEVVHNNALSEIKKLIN